MGPESAWTITTDQSVVHFANLLAMKPMGFTHAMLMMGLGYACLIITEQIVIHFAKLPTMESTGFTLVPMTVPEFAEKVSLILRLFAEEVGSA